MYSSFSSYNGFYDEKEYYDDLPIIVPELTDSTITMINKNPTVLLCYAPWCSHCVQFKPMFTELANACKDLPNVKFAQLDASKWTLSANLFDIKAFPTIFLVSNGKNIPYTGTRTIPLIKTWIKSTLKI
jgi:thioredoxin 1